MAGLLETTLRELSAIQRKAVEWDDGNLLVLAGPGSGKTRVLTCRAAVLLDQSPRERFRVLALTFTNKAANEMSRRVADLAPGLEERADIHTFHSFCAQVLRQHGAHLGIKPDFAIYSRMCDRRAVLEDALRREPRTFQNEDRRLLPTIDNLKARLVGPGRAEEWVAERSGGSIENAFRAARAYQLYEKELRNENALDFNSLILEAHRLFQYPAMARHYQTVYKYWLIDEFQDTNAAQYELLRRMAGRNVAEVFAVADDDQTIYEWNGANVRRIKTLVEDFRCQIVQLPMNYRCPPLIVETANRLVAYNVRRAVAKQEARPGQRHCTPGSPQIRCRVFETGWDEAAGIAKEIAVLNSDDRDQTVVLGRTRALIESMRQALEAESVGTTVLRRRDDFISPQMRWLVALLRQLNDPFDRRNIATLVETFASFAPLPLDVDDVLSSAIADGVTYLSVWSEAACRAQLPPPSAEIVHQVVRHAAGDAKLASAIEKILRCFEGDDSNEDLKEDLSAWQRLSSEIRSATGPTSLDRFLQELELRSKEPAPEAGAVSLATIHGAKGLEFNTVYLIGLAEEILPSWHSINNGDDGAALEEERRSCFVAITRAKQQLILSRAENYKGWRKRPSRFLAEMGFARRGS